MVLGSRGGWKSGDLRHVVRNRNVAHPPQPGLHEGVDFRVTGPGFSVLGSGFRVSGLEFMA